MTYQMPKAEEVVPNLRAMADNHGVAFAHSVVCRQAAEEIETLRDEVRFLLDHVSNLEELAGARLEDDDKRRVEHIWGRVQPATAT